MILKQLILKNFRQFKGEQVITFPVYGNKNVIVVCGNNTAGKTTLIQAFYWVLYGKADFKSKGNLLNLEIANSMKEGDKEEVKVSLVLVDRGIEYTVTRKQEYIHIGANEPKPLPSKIEMFYKDEQGNIKPIIREYDIIDTINKILPEELSYYFFFDGERIGNLAKRNKDGKEELTTAVRNILGLAEIVNAIEHLSGKPKNSVIGMLRNSLDEKGEERIKVLKEAINNLEMEKQEVERMIKTVEDNIKNYEQKINDIEEILRKNEETAALQTKIDSNKRLINTLNETLKEKEKRLRSIIQDKLFAFFVTPLVEKIENDLIKFNSSIKVVPKISTETIDYIIQQGVCICGNRILKDSEEYKRLVALREYLPPKYIGTAVNEFLADAYSYKNDGKRFIDEIKEIYEGIWRCREDIKNLEEDNENIMKKIGDKKDLRYLKGEKENWIKLKQQEESRKSEMYKRLGVIEKDIEEKNKELSKLADKSENNRFIKLCIKYAEYLSDSLKRFYKQKEEEIREKLNEKVNEIFLKMYHGQGRKIIIDSNYDYQIITEYLNDELKNKADESRGLETVMSFAFIGGIIQLAREKITNSSKLNFGFEDDDEFNIELDTEPYPLVMDAPFSNVDEIHVESVSRILPEIAEQVIMFIMNKDWNYAQKVLESKIAARYELQKISETHTIIRKT
ncbi:MAG: hypothetical protein JG775_2594 [Defluviitaleaceae bacterium]|jgi:DNA sulfur modification protein DndD|uniref:AAA family ATPase n=1 Tax=Thermosipho sp. (in: thermotogales) TaxID=1968895 RepID=UPI00257BEAEC|nr:AAA family ATPase [Thermosipho sp. (in: thermotogales)]MBZ4650444.1 hypothetical protein [Thermosipho sp. (in: thermotogales)]MBZ4669441.1 hypothetical protein [Defluviitaleaceae bacterium]MDK2814309.1 sulfur modification protein DndD [Thermoanaerobacter sp.]MDK2840119.1 sulfur modification protein DndD [Thermosipho sp. (in: thermotogales)]